MRSFGYEKILHVNLSTGKIEQNEIEPEFAHKFGGGMGFGCKIIYDQVTPEIEPLSPDNLLIVATGPFAGTNAPCTSRAELTTRDPLTGSIGSGNTGGMFGPTLKHAGFDAIVIKGKSEKPVYLYINNDSVQTKDASHLWGKNAFTTTDLIKQELSPNKVSVLAIGEAGENIVKYSCPVTDYFHYAARSGAGPVMGSKKLKAIVVCGTGVVQIARPNEFQLAVREARERILSRKTGLGEYIIKDAVEVGYLPGKNFQTGFIPEFLRTRGQDIAQSYFSKQVATCYACPRQCINMVEVKEGKYAGLKFAPSLRAGMVFAWGATCAIDSLPAIWKCMELCSHFGLDYSSASNTIGFAMELFQRGLITKADTDGIELNWGNSDAVVEMLSRIALRKGFGDVLAEGVQEAAKKIGKGSDQFAMTIKGRELVGEDLRAGKRGFLFGYMTNPRGGDNLKGTHFQADVYVPDWWVDKFDMFEDIKKIIYCVPPEETPRTWKGKPMMTVWFEDLYSVANSFGVCIFPVGMYLAIGPTYLSKLYSACTGWDMTPQEIMSLGERTFNLLKAYTIRQGLSRKDDYLPARFFKEALPEGPAKGAVLSRENIDKLLDEYYMLRGWDIESGVPTKEKLVELGLADIADDLAKRGRLPKDQKRR